MVYKVDGGTVIDQDGNLQIENLRATATNPNSTAYAAGRTFGYLTGGYLSPITKNTIFRFPFASTTTNTSDVGDLTSARMWIVGASSSTHGYAAGGYILPSSAHSDIIEKYPFSGLTNSSDVGDLTQGRYGAAAAYP